MRDFRTALAALVLMAMPLAARAQIAEPATTDSLRRAVELITARLDSLEAGQCPAAGPIALPAPRPGQQPVLDSLVTALETLNARLARALAAGCPAARAGAAPVPAPAPAPADSTGELAALRAAAAQAAGVPAQDTTGGAPLADTTRAQPAPTGAPGGPRAANLLNPEISVTGDVRLVARDENPQRDNAVPREFEFSFQSALDPYSKTKIFITFEQEELGIEEAYIYWTALPGHLRLDIGKFRQQLGDLNRWHLHALPETEYPLVYQRFLGEEGLAGVGLSVYTTLPVSLAGGTHEIALQGTTAESEPLYADGRQPTLLGRVQNFWQLSRSSYAQLGFTATGGNNGDADLRSRLLGVDVRFTYRPPEAATRRDVTFRAEGYRLHASEAGSVTNRYGAFLDLQVRTSRRWIFGARYDWVEAARGAEDTEWRITPTITWWQSEFVYLRLEGEHRDSDLAGTQNLLTFQVVWAMGPHKHETY
ncbi:MAG TPA: hypothetical protein VFU46_02245 [Gemmatimonadales bacterium]|nr:hypothetical protein [Gemmatimonadales bacterium]